MKKIIQTLDDFKDPEIEGIYEESIRIGSSTFTKYALDNFYNYEWPLQKKVEFIDYVAYYNYIPTCSERQKLKPLVENIITNEILDIAIKSERIHTANKGNRETPIIAAAIAINNLHMTYDELIKDVENRPIEEIVETYLRPKRNTTIYKLRFYADAMLVHFEVLVDRDDQVKLNKLGTSRVRLLLQSLIRSEHLSSYERDKILKYVINDDMTYNEINKKIENIIEGRKTW